MLMRSPTRIEFKAEDAQEYIKSRERQRKNSGLGILSSSLGASSLGAVDPASPSAGASGSSLLPATPGQHGGLLGGAGHLTSSSAISPLGGAAGPPAAWSGTAAPPAAAAAPGETGAPPASSGVEGAAGVAQQAAQQAAAQQAAAAQAAAAQAAAAVMAQYGPQVEQLTSMGFGPEQARQAIAATGGDVEAAADWLLS